jgi:hypothetical protein
MTHGSSPCPRQKIPKQQCHILKPLNYKMLRMKIYLPLSAMKQQRGAIEQQRKALANTTLLPRLNPLRMPTSDAMMRSWQQSLPTN